MIKKTIAGISGLLIGFAAIAPLAQADDVIHRSIANDRPFALTDKRAQVQAVRDDIEVFVRLDLPSVAEYNVEALRNGKSMPTRDAQKAHAARISAQY